MDFQAFPKVELHVHLDCSLSFRVVSRIDPAITQPEYNSSFIAPPKCIDLADYLIRTEASIALMQTRQHLKWVTEDLIDQLAEDNVLYAEIRFAPLQHTRQGLTPKQVVETVIETITHYDIPKKTPAGAYSLYSPAPHGTTKPGNRSIGHRMLPHLPHSDSILLPMKQNFHSNLITRLFNLPSNTV
jgi:hypothetical protein